MNLLNLMTEFLEASQNCIRRSLLEQGEATGWAGAAERLRVEMEVPSPQALAQIPRPTAANLAKPPRTPTLTPVLNILRMSPMPLTINEIIGIAKAHGYDLREKSVAHVLSREEAKKTVERVGGDRYRIPFALGALPRGERE